MNDTGFKPDQMKILIVDDTVANVDVLTSTLLPLGYQLAVANSGDKALKVAARFAPDLILLDVMMPGIDGFEVCRLLKEDTATAHIPVIFVTAKIETDDVVRGLRLGAVDYVTKPFRAEEVVARVGTHLMLKHTIDAMKRANAEKDRVLGAVAHDLRNPLAGMRGYAFILRESGATMTESERAEMLGEIYSTCDGMLAMVGDLLDSAAIDTGSVTLTRRPFDVAQLVKHRVGLARMSAQKKNTTIDEHYDSNLVVDGDQRRIGQVVDNLVSNAVKFSPPGSKIVVRVAATPSGAEVRVEDEGPGLTSEDHKKLFSAYVSLSARPTGGEVSTGLGLAISKKVVDAHGGTMAAAAREPKGTAFFFTLPRATGNTP